MTEDPDDREEAPADPFPDGAEPADDGDPFMYPDDEGNRPGDDSPAPANDETSHEGADQPAGPDDASGAPFDDLASREGDPFEGADSPFQQVEVEGPDPEAVWETLGEEPEAADPADEPRYDEVSKHAFCERCEHFSPPPDVTCTHDTADIVEFLDMETVRLRDCPVVAQRRKLEQVGSMFDEEE